MKKFVIAALPGWTLIIAVFALVATFHLENRRLENEEQIALLRSEVVDAWLAERALRLDLQAVRAEIESAANLQEAEEMLTALESFDMGVLSFDPVTDVYEGEIVDVDVHNIFK